MKPSQKLLKEKDQYVYIAEGEVHKNFLSIRSQVNLLVLSHALEMQKEFLSTPAKGRPTIDQLITQVFGNLYYQSFISGMERMTATVVDECRDKKEGDQFEGAKDLVLALHEFAQNFMHTDVVMSDAYCDDVPERVMKLAHNVVCEHCREDFMRGAIEKADYIPKAKHS